MCGCGSVPTNVGQTAAAIEAANQRASQDARRQADEQQRSTEAALANASSR